MADIGKIFMNGRSQAIRLPKSYRFDGKEVYIRRDPKTGDVILSKKSIEWSDWEEFFRSVAADRKKYPEQFANFLIDRDQGLPQERDLF